MRVFPKKKSHFRKVAKTIPLNLFILFSVFCSAQVTTQTFSYTGAVQSFTVPSCVFNLTLNVSGARGGSNAGGVLGGLGGSASGVLSVIPGDVLYFYVGSSTGYNGGGLAGFSSCTGAIAGCGGGATDIRLNGNTLNSRIIVGGGGGGAAGNRIVSCGRGNGGGGGGGYYGGGGGSAWPGATGWTMSSGGTQTSGGTGGISITSTSNGTFGVLGSGGNGGCEISSTQAGTNLGLTGGAGGGLTGAPGQYVAVGGGGGSETTGNWTGMSGAGGSSYTGTLTNAATINGNNAGDGVATIAYSVGPFTIPSVASICQGSSINLTASGQVSYTWSTGSFASSITVTPSLTTSYSVVGVNLLGCISTTVFNITVDGSGPTIGISNSSNSLCPGNTVTLTAFGAPTFTWTGGVQNGVPFSLFSSSSYTVSGSNGCGTATATTSVFINPAPTISITASSPSVCSGNTVMLTASGANSYSWTGNILNGSFFTPLATSVYTVMGTSSLSCSGIAITTITVYNNPNTPPSSSQSTICVGSSATLTGNSVANYTWLPGNLNTASISVNPSVTTIYTLTQSNTQCTDVKTISIVVIPALSIAALASNSLICANDAVTLTAGGALTYSWLPGNLNSPNVIVSPTASLVYTVNASNGICNASTTLTLQVNPVPNITISASPSVICLGDVSTLSVSGANNYTWVPANLSGINPTVSPTIPTLYSVTGENSFGCKSGASQVILLSPSPTITASASKTLVCLGDPSALMASGAATYSWSTGAQSSTTLVNPLINTIYTVTGHSSSYNCATSKTVAVSVYTPTFSVSANTVVCLGGSVILSASGANSYTWNGTSPFQNFTASPSVATMYVVSATSNSLSVSCVTSASVLVSIAPDPTVTASSNKLIVCKGEKVILTGSGASTYLWVGLSSGSTIQVTPSGSQTAYTVTGTDSNGCTSTGTVLVKVSACSGIEKTGTVLSGIIIYPNPTAGNFSIRSDSEINLKIFDSLGRVVKDIQLNATTNFEVTISDLSKAVYFIAGEKDNYQFKSKLIVTH